MKDVDTTCFPRHKQVVIGFKDGRAKKQFLSVTISNLIFSFIPTHFVDGRLKSYNK